MEVNPQLNQIKEMADDQRLNQIVKETLQRVEWLIIVIIFNCVVENFYIRNVFKFINHMKVL